MKQMLTLEQMQRIRTVHRLHGSNEVLVVSSYNLASGMNGPLIASASVPAGLNVMVRDRSSCSLCGLRELIPTCTRPIMVIYLEGTLRFVHPVALATSSHRIYPSSGVATFEQLIAGAQEAFNMDYNFAMAVSAFGIVSQISEAMLSFLLMRMESLPEETPSLGSFQSVAGPLSSHLFLVSLTESPVVSQSMVALKVSTDLRLWRLLLMRCFILQGTSR